MLKLYVFYQAGMSKKRTSLNKKRALSKERRPFFNTCYSAKINAT